MCLTRFKILETQTTYTARLRCGVAEIHEETGSAPEEAALIIELGIDVWVEIVLGLTTLADARRAGRLDITGDPEEFLAVSRAFRTGAETLSIPS